MAEESKTLAEFAGLGGRALARAYGIPGATEAVTLSVASARTTVALQPDSHYRIVSSVDCAIKFGDATVDALTTDFPMFSKVPVVLYVKAPVTHVAGIAGGAGVLYVTKMEGA